MAGVGTSQSAALISQFLLHASQAFVSASPSMITACLPIDPSHSFFQPLYNALAPVPESNLNISIILPALNNVSSQDTRDSLARFLLALLKYVKGGSTNDSQSSSYETFRNLLAVYNEGNKLYSATSTDGGYSYPFLNQLIVSLARSLVRASEQAAAFSPYPIRDSRSARSIRDSTRQAIERSFQVSSSVMNESEWSAECSRSQSVSDNLWPLGNILWRIYSQRKLHTQSTELIKSFSNLVPKEQKRISARGHAVSQEAIAESYYWRGKLGVVLLDMRNAKFWLDQAWAFCPETRFQQRRAILVRLIPVNLLLGRIPAPAMLKTFNMEADYAPIIHAFKTGNVPAWRRIIETKREWLRRRSTWLLLFERGEILVWRNLFRKSLKAYYASNPTVARNRCPTWVFVAAASRVFKGSGELEDGTIVLEDIICVLSSLIDQSLVLGNLSYSQQFLVMRQSSDGMGGFPPIAQVIPRRVEAIA